MPVEPRRRHGSADAVVLGLAAMLGTGVFIVFAPAARSAGAWLPLAVLLAAAVAAASAFAEADLAAEDPGPGAGYRYGREPAWSSPTTCCPATRVWWLCR
jgi:APA family basic amino acid/polyamine antiporter